MITDRRLVTAVSLSAALALTVGCDNATSSGSVDGSSATPVDGSDSGVVVLEDGGHDDAAPDGSMDSDPCSSSPSACADAGDTCGASDEVLLRPVPVRVGFVVQSSLETASYWSGLVGGVKTLLEHHPDALAGAHVVRATTENENAVVSHGLCGALEHRVLGTQPSAAGAVVNFLVSNEPLPLASRLSLRPVLGALARVVEHDPGLSSEASTNYLVVVAPNGDNCAPVGHATGAAEFERMAAVLSRRNLRLLPIAVDLPGSSTAMMDALAVHGGAGLDKALTAQDGPTLQAVLATLSERLTPCRFEALSQANPATSLVAESLTVMVDGSEVARDRRAVDGWNTVSGRPNELELFGDACRAVQGGKRLRALSPCRTSNACDSTTLQVSSKPRMIQFLLDTSFSMAACSVLENNGMACALDPSARSWWHLAAEAVAHAAAAPANSTAELGLTLFSGSNQGQCVLDAGTVAVGTDAVLSILTTLRGAFPAPTGSGSLVTTLEELVHVPGKLADVALDRALVLLTEGDDTCSAATNEEVVQRASGAITALRDRGVRVYPIRVGPDGNAQDQVDAVMRALVAASGTALPASVLGGQSYYRAGTDTGLASVLDTVSALQTSCVLSVPQLPSTVDVSKLRLYQDGELVPMDNNPAAERGFSLQQTLSTITLLGDTCRLLQERNASLRLEIGC